MNKDQNGRIVYADIYNLPHFQSKTRPHMSLYDRAAQFAPFAALTGYDDMVTEEARLTDKSIELSETELAALNRKIELVELLLQGGGYPTLSFTYFEPDKYKAGGKYLKRIGAVKKIDTYKKLLVLFGSDDTENKKIPTIDISLDRIIDISGFPAEYDEYEKGLFKNPDLHTAANNQVFKPNCSRYLSDLGFLKTNSMIFSTFSRWSDGGLITKE